MGVLINNGHLKSLRVQVLLLLYSLSLALIAWLTMTITIINVGMSLLVSILTINLSIDKLFKGRDVKTLYWMSLWMLWYIVFKYLILRDHVIIVHEKNIYTLKRLFVLFKCIYIYENNAS